MFSIHFVTNKNAHNLNTHFLGHDCHYIPNANVASSKQIHQEVLVITDAEDSTWQALYTLSTGQYQLYSCRHQDKH